MPAIRKTMLIAALAVPMAAQAVERPLAFVTCPIVRDTKNVPCWLAEYRGELYYLGIQIDSQAAFRPPSLGRKALIEGTPTLKPRICGGIPLEPLQISPLPELAPECQTILPAEDRYDLPFEPPRPPGPGRRPLIFFTAPQTPTPPYQPKTFDLPYDFDTLVDSRHAQRFRLIVAYARQISARKITITGFRSATKLSSGERLTEQEGIGERRAKQLAELLVGGGLTEPAYEVKWTTKAVVGNPAPRIVRVVVSP
jgi:hypothetical protein